MGLEFGVLGPVRASENGVPLAVPAGKQRLLLAVLLARANRPVPAGTIVQTLWPGEATPGSRASLHNHVMRLRRTLGATASARVCQAVARSAPALPETDSRQSHKHDWGWSARQQFLYGQCLLSADQQSAASTSFHRRSI